MNTNESKTGNPNPNYRNLIADAEATLRSATDELNTAVSVSVAEFHRRVAAITSAFKHDSDAFNKAEHERVTANLAEEAKVWDITPFIKGTVDEINAANFKAYTEGGVVSQEYRTLYLDAFGAYERHEEAVRDVAHASDSDEWESARARLEEIVEEEKDDKIIPPAVRDILRRIRERQWEGQGGLEGFKNEQKAALESAFEGVVLDAERTYQQRRDDARALWLLGKYRHHAHHVMLEIPRSFWLDLPSGIRTLLGELAMPDNAYVGCGWEYKGVNGAKETRSLGDGNGEEGCGEEGCGCGS